ncbi:MAG: hypothetical protein ACXV2C_03925 [Candidatus Bathyarchaeia archaeon]
MTSRVVHVKDFTLGILVMVMAALLLYFSWFETDYIPIWQFIILLFSAWCARILIGMGVMFIKGIDVDIS